MPPLSATAPEFFSNYAVPQRAALGEEMNAQNDRRKCKDFEEGRLVATESRKLTCDLPQLKMDEPASSPRASQPRLQSEILSETGPGLKTTPSSVKYVPPHARKRRNKDNPFSPTTQPLPRLPTKLTSTTPTPSIQRTTGSDKQPSINHWLHDIMATLKPTPIIRFSRPVDEIYPSTAVRPFAYFGVKNQDSIDTLDSLAITTQNSESAAELSCGLEEQDSDKDRVTSEEFQLAQEKWMFGEGND